MRSTLAALLAVALGILPMAVSAAVLHVPADYAQIQDAVDAASAGDTVLVAAGTYTDCTHETEGPGSTPACVIMKSGITLRGSGTDATIIDAQGLGRGIFIELVGDCRVENLQVRGAYAAAYGAGILVRQVDASVAVTDVLVTACTDGGVICINNASPVLTRVDCVGNEAKQGGGLAIEEGSSPRVVDCEITGNSAPSGAGIFIRNNCAPVIRDCLVADNTINAPYGQGGGIFIGEASPEISHCRITGNTTLGNGGGVAYQLGSAGSLLACEIRGNRVQQNYGMGAGIAVDSSSPLIEGCLVVENVCVGNGADGAGVHAIFSPSPVLRHCTIARNTTGSGGTTGGVLAQWNAAPELDHCIVAFATTGAGIGCDGGTPTLSCCDVYGNAGGDALCGTDNGGNFSADPLFCGSDVYTLQAGSPCLAGCDGSVVGAVPGQCGATAVPDLAGCRLLGNHPNPFNPSTTIVFSLDEPATADVRIVDATGREVARYILGDLPAGRHQVVWNGRDAMGRSLASGLYVCELRALGQRRTMGMTLLK